MIFSRYTALRASSIARSVRPARYIRSAELQPWQRMVQRRPYASAHGSDAHTQTSDLPWMAAAAVTTAAGLYLVLTQDLSHGEEHDKRAHPELHPEVQGKPDEEPAQPVPPEEKEEKQKSEDDKSDGSEKQENKPPSESDKPDPSKQPKSSNETSGKQEGFSNDDTAHSSNIHDNPEKSKKGEGVAETAKVKGTVSPDRPPAENKEERGKEAVDKEK